MKSNFIFSGLSLSGFIIVLFSLSESSRFSKHQTTLLAHEFNQNMLCPDFDGDGACETIQLLEIGNVSMLTVYKSAKVIFQKEYLFGKEGVYTRIGLNNENNKDHLLFANGSPRESLVFAYDQENHLSTTTPSASENQILNSLHAAGQGTWLFYSLSNMFWLATGLSLICGAFVFQLIYNNKLANKSVQRTPTAGAADLGSLGRRK